MRVLRVYPTMTQAIQASHYDRPETVTLVTPSLEWRHDNGDLTRFIGADRTDFPYCMSGLTWDKIAVCGEGEIKAEHVAWLQQYERPEQEAAA